MGKLDGRVAVVTGGASGIGEASVRLFHEEGCRVVIADLDDAAGERLAGELGAATTRFQHTDVTSEEDVAAAVGAAVSAFGRLDCMFSNAGVSGDLRPIEEVTVREYDLFTSVNLKGAFLGMKWAAPVMKKQGSGSIITTSSMGGLMAENAPHLYCAVKAAVNHLTRCVANELGGHHVRVNCISPGAILTPIFTRGLDLTPEQEADAMSRAAEALGQFQPIPRAGLPEDVARAALWLASDDSSFVTGANLVVDGGKTLGDGWDFMIAQQEAM
jgi:NAD(P)-dependent dehydrogenase (short-subunit alcohol dehydrogenase family)